MNQAEEDLLVISARAGNEEAFGFLFRHYHKPLLRFACKLGRDEQLAADAVQDAWIRIARTIRRLDDPRAFRSWIYRAVRWRVLDLLRKSRTVDVTQDGELPETAGDGGRADQVNVAELHGLLSRLPEIERQALHLFYLDEMKISEIAAVLEIPPGTVKSRLNRARGQLRELYERTTGESHGH
jgi:RNA polymerase sigma-70 factor (ECF subfamily)